MSNEFNVSDFRRQRAGHAAAPAPNPQAQPQAHSQGNLAPVAPVAYEAAPMHMQNSPQFSEQTIPAQTPDLMANPYAAALANHTAAAPAGQVAPPPFQTPPTQNIRAAVPAPQLGSTPVKTQQVKEKPKSLFAGLLAKLKPSGKASSPQAPRQTAEAELGGPVVFNPGQDITAAAPIPEPVASPAYGEPDTVADTFTASSPAEIEETSKPRLPVWAAFLLGMMAGIILTFGILTFLASTAPSNTLEARFGQGQQTAQAEVSPTESAGLTEEATTGEAVIPANR